MLVVEAQICRKCGEHKPLEEFSFHSARQKHQTTCKQCYREARQAQYRADVELSRVKGRASRLRHRDTENKRLRRYRETNDHAAYQREWRAENPEKSRNQKKDFYARHRDRLLVEMATRRMSRGTQREVTESGAAYCEILLLDPCSYCGLYDDLVIDHIDPIRNGGSGEWDNLTVACRTCNLVKKHFPLLIFLLHRRERHERYNARVAA